MPKLSRHRRPQFNLRSVQAALGEARAGQHMIIDGYAPSQMIEDLRKYQAELESRTRR